MAAATLPSAWPEAAVLSDRAAPDFAAIGFWREAVAVRALAGLTAGTASLLACRRGQEGLGRWQAATPMPLPMACSKQMLV